MVLDHSVDAALRHQAAVLAFRTRARRALGHESEHPIRIS
jgi:hypothetical protein